MSASEVVKHPMHSSDSSDQEVDENEDSKFSSGAIARTESFLERQNFADGESEAGENPRSLLLPSTGDSAEATALWQQQQPRRRRGSRASRTNSTSERCLRSQGSTSPASAADCSSEEDEETEEAVMTAAGKKRRKKRKRPVDEGEKALRQKMAEIDRVLTCGDDVVGSLERLRDLAVSEGGLLDDDTRRKVWPRLVNIRLVEAEVLPSQEECEGHPEYTQVVMDVVRSLKRFPPGISEEIRPGLQDQLTRLIVRVLLKHPHLHYYQGYHDVAITFLLVVGEEMGYHVMQRLSVSHLADFMAPTMEKTTYLLNYMYPMISRESPQLHDFMDASEVGTIFALSWLITWFGHVLPNYDDVVRLYDFFLSKPPLMPVYLAAALVLHREQEILMAECDLACVHGLLSRIPVDLPFEKLLVDSQKLYDMHPPKTLEHDVKLRIKRIEALNGPRGRHRGGRLSGEARTKFLGIPLSMGTLAVIAPVVIGIIAWKWYHA